MRRLVAAMLLLAGCRLTHEEPTIDADTSPRIRVATFNVRRFFDPVCDSGACGPDDYELQPSAAAFEARATQIADAIRTLEADVIALEEVESQACLDALLARLGDALPYGVLGETDLAASVDVAVLSRTPIESVVRHRDATPLALPDGTPTTFARELLEVHVRASNGTEVAMFAAHFKSKSNDDPARRLAEAQAAGRIVRELAARAPEMFVVLGGDLNDTPDSPPLAALTRDAGLVRAADDLAAVAQATYYYKGRGQAIDHLLLAPGTDAHRVAYSTHAWREDRGWGGSDHAALTTDLRLP